MEDKELTSFFVTQYLDKDDKVQKLEKELKQLKEENGKLKNPQLWTNDGDL
ncbi:hypothetical protein ACFFIX_06530 [Metabacillus herbersteinensis]|uniref:Uncharacterized protein n=1 Tax=Metabacillus herbersteinensis TaxID=283816 RepID=A0ABV6GBR0_9BACI